MDQKLIEDFVKCGPAADEIKSRTLEKIIL